MRLPYRSLNSQLQTVFGERVQKIPLDAGLLCPNKNGEISANGCIFCDSYGSGYIEHHGLPLAVQIEKFKRHRKEHKFLAYFQANCNTNAPVEQLAGMLACCMKHKDVCGIIIATRPDCLPEDVLLLLESFSKKTFLVVELGLQSVKDDSLIWLNRNHTYAQFETAFFELQRRKIRTVVHLIVGLPSENAEDNRETIQEMNKLMPWGVKFHVLHVLKGTRLHEMYMNGELELIGREEYITRIIELLENLHPDIGVHRLSADRDVQLFVAPLWAQQKTTLLNQIHQRMIRTGCWQGKKLGFPKEACWTDQREVMLCRIQHDDGCVQ